jgi:uncharacterized protein (DUF488 family)
VLKIFLGFEVYFWGGFGDQTADSSATLRNDTQRGFGMMTIGHSTLALESFLRALRENGVTTLVDVRRFPGSRRHPQFSQERLFASLREAGIRPIWREGLGGRREPLADSVNTGWKNESFRGYADYMQTDHFANEIGWLMALADFDSMVVMCAEAVPWRCHRSLIGDAVLARGGVVEDIFVEADGKSSRRPRAMTDFARVDGDRVWYPGEGELFA